MKKLGGENGQTLVMVALSMAVLLGLAAFATDIGVMLHEKRRVQSAADSAAIAAASALIQGTDPVSAGTAAATANGFTNATDSNGNATTTVNVYATPIDGHFAGQSGYTEATIVQQTPGFFMHIFGLSSMAIGGRAVATDKGVSDSCIRTNEEMVLQGSFHVNAPLCGVEVESSDPDGLQFTGGAGSLVAGSVSVVGGDGGQTGDSTPAPTTGALHTSDPLAGKLTAPTFGPDTCTATTSIGVSGSQTYIANPTGTVCFSSTGDINLRNVNLAPGTYVFDNPLGTLVLDGNINGPMNSDGSADTTPGDGVTLYLLGGMNEQSGTVLNLSADTTAAPGTSGSLLLWAAPTDVNTGTKGICPTGGGNAGPGIIQLNVGNSSGNFIGEIYAPNSDLVFQDSGSDSNGPDLVTDINVGNLCDETADLNVTSFSKTYGTGQFPKISLVE